MFQIFFIAAILIALAIAGLAVGIIIKGKFPDTHVGHNANMKKLGITCAKNDSSICQGRSKTVDCQRCDNSKYVSAIVFLLLIAPFGIASGQEQDSVHMTRPFTIDDAWDNLLNFNLDSIPDMQNGYYFTEDSFAVDTLLSDSLAFLPDSLRQRVVIGLSDRLDTLSNKLFAYNVLKSNSFARMQVAIDTTLSRFDINNPVMRKYHAGAHLGNLGLSYYPIGFGERLRPSDFMFFDHLYDYLHDPEKTTYYQTQFPYTHIDFSSAGPKSQNETVFRLVHTQNVNKNLNIGFYYDAFSSVGQYVNQNSSVNGISLFSAYRSSQYSMYTNFNWNNVRMRENGGLSNLEDFELNEEDASGNSVRSNEGKTIMLNRSFYMTHSFSPVRISFNRSETENDTIEASRLSFVHTLKYEWNTREYSDTATYALRERQPYFWEPVMGVVHTHDSLHFRRISNHFKILFREQPQIRSSAGFSAGLLMELDRFNINMIPDTTLIYINQQDPQYFGWGVNLPEIMGTERVVNYRQTRSYLNNAFTGSLFNHTGRHLNWDINGRMYFMGYKLGNTSLEGSVRIHYYTSKGRNSLLLGGSIDNANPGYFVNSYSSNLMNWENNFNSSQEVRLRGEFMMPTRQLKLGVHLSQLNNYIYMNSEATPEQSPELLMTGTAYVEKDLTWWKLGFRFRLYGQYSSNQAIIPLPLLAGYQSTYFEDWLVKDVLIVQLGWNLIYNTKYYAHAYMPATGMFYLQNEQEIGNYPFFDFFLNLQIKRARLFIKTEGINTLFSKTLGKRNYMTYRYPTNDFRMKFGVSWAFYD